jgi:transposase
LTVTIAVDDGLWERVEVLILAKPQRFRNPGRKRLDDRRAMNGILFVLHTGIAWRHLPRELSYGSGVICWRRLREWQEAGVWARLHLGLLAELDRAGEIDWSGAVVDSSHVRALLGGSTPGLPRSTVPAREASTMS